MICYQLKCERDHSFEGWFSSSSDYDTQSEKGWLCCPECNSPNVTKAIMAPNVSTSRKKDSIAQEQAKALQMMNQAADKIRKKIETECDYVGDKFTEEARAIHYGEKDERPIYGQATPKDVQSLCDEGISVSPLPDILTPKRKSEMN